MIHLRTDNIMGLVQERCQQGIVGGPQKRAEAGDEVVGLVPEEKDPSLVCHGDRRDRESKRDGVRVAQGSQKREGMQVVRKGNQL